MVIERIKALKLPARSVAFLLVCAGGLLGFFLLVIYPQQTSLVEADMEIRELKGRIEEQKILYPVFQDLLRKARFKGTEGLPFPTKAKLNRNETVNILSIFRDIAKKNHLTLVDIRSDIESFIDSSGYLKIDLVAEGRFFDLRNFMLSLGELPYLEHIERIQIHSIQEKKAIDLKIWIAQE